MDNFMSKLSQKINAQDTIKANFMADAAEKEQMKKQLAEYDSMMQSVRNLYLKQEENSEIFKELSAKLDDMLAAADKQQELVTKLDALAAEENSQPELLAEMKEQISKSDEFTHKECVKVYRNVQALLEEQDKKLASDVEALKAQGEALQLQVEASKAKDMTEDLAELTRMVKKSNRSTKALLWLLMLISAANVAVVLLIHFGLF